RLVGIDRPDRSLADDERIALDGAITHPRELARPEGAKRVGVDAGAARQDRPGETARRAHDAVPDPDRALADGKVGGRGADAEGLLRLRLPVDAKKGLVAPVWRPG